MANDPMADVQHVTDGAALDALGLPHRVRLPKGDGLHPALIMLHGLHGNEDVTWVFARSASPEWAILSPRGPVAGSQGYRWYNLAEDGTPDRASFSSGLNALEHFIDGAIRHYPIDLTRLVLLGFSQGTAMVYAYALTHRQRLAGIVALSGFIVRLDEITIPPLESLPVLILHGTQDDTVPVGIAQKARDRLQAAGASVTYEESDVGHKISAAGMRMLTAWLAARLAVT